MFEYEMWLNAAREKCRDLRIGTVFVLKDLFLGVEWDTLSGGEKRELGRRFKNCVLRDLVHNIIYIGKADNNSAQYRKI